MKGSPDVSRGGADPKRLARALRRPESLSADLHPFAGRGCAAGTETEALGFGDDLARSDEVASEVVAPVFLQRRFADFAVLLHGSLRLGSNLPARDGERVKRGPYFGGSVSPDRCARR